MRLVSRVAVFMVVTLTLAAFIANTVSLAEEAKGSADRTKVKSIMKIDPELVKAVQKALLAAGYKVKVDAKVGPQMRAALKKYQKKNGLSVTGRIDERTLEKMGM